jgi:hypothetical protein
MRSYRNNLEDRYALVDYVASTEAHALADEVDAGIRQLDLAKLIATPVLTRDQAIAKVITLYTPFRPFFRWIAGLRLWPSTWRDGLTAFFDALDVVGVAIDPGFKAGKDV